MCRVITAIGAIFALRIGVSLAIQSYLVPSMNEIDTPPDCNGNCAGGWNDWNNWSSCQGSKNCHITPGRQTRDRSCYIRFSPSPSRGDAHDEPVQDGWRIKCKEKRARSCVVESTCSGSWANWGSWTSCGTTSQTNATCYRSRHRVCLDMRMRNRIKGDSCYGGMHKDTDVEPCAQDPCPLLQQTSAPMRIPPDVVAKSAIGNPGAAKSGTASNHHTMIILAVTLGSVVFGVVFIILVINLIRQTSNSRRARHARRADDWKRFTSTTTSSYVAASEIASCRTEFSEVRSPSNMTVTSGESSSSSTNPNTCRNDSVFIYSAADDSNGATLNAFASKPRRSRLIQDNVYWEITDQSHNAHYSEVSSIFPEQDREEVPNVLYDTEA